MFLVFLLQACKGIFFFCKKLRKPQFSAEINILEENLFPDGLDIPQKPKK